MSLRIKICGITNVGDAMAAAEAGADAVGFMFYAKSSRYVDSSKAKEIIRELPPFIAKVGVFVNPGHDEVRAAIAESGIDTLQFHGEEPPEFCQSFPLLKTIKAFRIRDVTSLKQLSSFKTSAWLLDSYVPNQHGGTGATFNWDLARQAKTMGQPVILAGGLNSGNVAEAVRRVEPFGLDVSSGVESEPGKKDAAKVIDFINAARAALES